MEGGSLNRNSAVGGKYKLTDSKRKRMPEYMGVCRVWSLFLLAALHILKSTLTSMLRSEGYGSKAGGRHPED